MHAEAHPTSKEFRSLGVGVHTIDNTNPGPFILQRISWANALLERVHGAYGNFDRRCQIEATRTNATRLQPAEILPVHPTGIHPFETKVPNAIKHY